MTLHIKGLFQELNENHLARLHMCSNFSSVNVNIAYNKKNLVM